MVQTLTGSSGLMRSMNALCRAGLCLALLMTLPAMAQQSSGPDEDESKSESPNPDLWEPGHNLGFVDLIITAGVSLGYDTNVTLANDDSIDSIFYAFTPSIRFEMPTKRSLTSLTYRGEFQKYTDSPIDNFDDQSLRAEYAFDPTVRVGFNVYADYREGHDQRGTGRRQGDLGLQEIDPDEFEALGFGADWSYGRAGAHGRIEVFGSDYDILYTNNRDKTILLDREEQRIGSHFFWRLTPKTSAFISYELSDIDYDVADLDSEGVRYMVGATWEMTKKTTGRVSYGLEERDFDTPQRQNYDGPTWDASIIWRHKPRSQYTLTSSRRTQESDGYGDYVVRTETLLTWDYTWKWGFRTSINVGLTGEDHEGIRSDNLVTFGLARTWSLGRHFNVGGSISYERRDSNVDEFNYDHAMLLVTLQGVF